MLYKKEKNSPACFAARLMEQKNSTPERVAAILGELVEDEAVRSKMQAALVPWHSPRAAGEIAENILRVSLSSSFSLPPGNPMTKGGSSHPGAPAQQRFSAA